MSFENESPPQVRSGASASIDPDTEASQTSDGDAIPLAPPGVMQSIEQDSPLGPEAPRGSSSVSDLHGPCHPSSAVPISNASSTSEQSILVEIRLPFPIINTAVIHYIKANCTLADFDNASNQGNPNISWNLGHRSIEMPINDNSELGDVLLMMERRGWRDHFICYRSGNDNANEPVEPVEGDEDDMDETGPIEEKRAGTKRKRVNSSADNIRAATE